MVVRFICGDQLSMGISSLKGCDKESDYILMCEVRDECQTPKHHKSKIAFILSAMRHFAIRLEGEGFRVRYVKLDDPNNTHSFKGEIIRFCQEVGVTEVVITHPGEYRVLKDIRSLSGGINVTLLEDTRFLCSMNDFARFAEGKKTLLMEPFYRLMRQKYDILMENGKPIGGKWNYDSENRKPPAKGLKIPHYTQFTPNDTTRAVIKMVQHEFADHFGDLNEGGFYFAVTREDALKVFDIFLTERLPNFGTYQDAMLEGEDFMFHSHISFYLNNGLLEPLELIKAVEVCYQRGEVEINAAEGFIRQVLGWREYVRGIYWLKMPDYQNLNFLNATNPLPEFYWTGKTEMNCMKECIRSTKQNSYAHHIQRLMVLGNFALIAGIKPELVNEWYLVVYADAYEWVEMPNVSGMILFADGGLLGSKPYAASGSYINKMSNYCKNCLYSVKEKNGENACPFNYLYWHFLMQNKDALEKNHRMSMIYKVLEKFTPEKVKNIENDVANFFSKIYD